MTDRQVDWANKIARLSALANRFGAEGQINLHKLMEAAIYAETRRTGWTHQPEVTPETMGQELEAIIDDLEGDGFAPDFITALERGRHALAEGRLPLIDETPDAYVCRTCGHIAVTQPPDRCPGCGAWPRRFRHFLGTFNLEAPDPLETLAALAEAPDVVKVLIAGLSEETMTRQPAGGGWSIRDIIQHLDDAQGVLGGRLELMIEQDNPDLTSQAVFAWVGEEERRPPTTREILAAFRETRETIIARLESLPLKDWWRTGQHEEFGTVTILHQASYFAFHEPYHFPQIEALRRQFVGAE